MAIAVTSSDRLVLADLVPGALVRDTALIAAGAGLTGLAAQVPVHTWLSRLSVQKAVDLGVTPFLLTDALKLAIAALVLPSAWTLVRRMR